jgi:hypothetical protein
MRAGLVSSAAYEIQLTADCELLQSCAARGRSTGKSAMHFSRVRVRTSLRSPDLKKAPNGLARYTEADDLTGEIDVGDRVGRDQAAVA